MSRASTYINHRAQSIGPRDLFEHFSCVADRIFEVAARSLTQNLNMNSQNSPFDNHLRLFPEETSNHFVGNYLLHGNRYRSFRHEANDPVQLTRSRLQWYDSNTRRALVPAPPVTANRQPCGRLNTDELAKLTISTYRVMPTEGNLTCTSPPGPIETPIFYGNSNNAHHPPGTAYLQVASVPSSGVPVVPLQSSPSRGKPECDVCLTEYHDGDRLRHLPCKHAFHAACIDVWFRQSSTCPKCRAGVRTGLKRLERTNRIGVGRPANRPPVQRITTTSIPALPAMRQNALSSVRQDTTGPVPPNSTIIDQQTETIQISGSNTNTESNINRTMQQEGMNTVTSEIRTSRSNSTHEITDLTEHDLMIGQEQISSHENNSQISPSTRLHPRWVNPGSPLYTRQLNSSSRFLPRLRNQWSGVPSRYMDITRRTRYLERMEACRPSFIQRTQVNQQPESIPKEDKNQLARKKAAEAAIKRDALARQERLREQSQPSATELGTRLQTVMNLTD